MDKDGWSRTAILCLGQTKGEVEEVVDERGSVQLSKRVSRRAHGWLREREGDDAAALRKLALYRASAPKIGHDRAAITIKQSFSPNAPCSALVRAGAAVGWEQRTKIVPLRQN